MSKQAKIVDVDDFSQVLSCLGLVVTTIGLSMPDGPHRKIAIEMGDDILSLLLKYSNDEKREDLLTLIKTITTENADTSTAH